MVARAPFRMVESEEYQPFKHQLETFESSRDLDKFGLLWEMGTGKTRTTYDTAAYRYAKGDIDGLLVVAPNGVHRNWITDELPRHVHPDADPFGLYYSTEKASTKEHQRKCQALLDYPRFKVLAMSYDGICTDKGKKLAKDFLVRNRCMYVLDESTRIKNVSAQRTKTVLASSIYAPVRRILTGTPITNGPFDIYGQMKFLDKDFWTAHGFDSYTTFKSFFGVWSKLTNNATGRIFDHCVGYQNLPMLARIIASITSRVLKEEVLDLPPKLYSNVYYEMSPKQRRFYEELRLKYVAELDGQEVAAGLALTRLLKLQQIVCGYVSVETGEPVQMIEEDNNPRLKCLEDVLEDIPHKAIIWSRFTKDIDLICKMLGETCVRYDGKVSESGRAEALDKFRRGDAKWFVGNDAACAEGLTLVEAKTVVRYANSFKLDRRLQSDDRAHRIGQDQPVKYIDLVCDNTVDTKIVTSLKGKFDIACQLTGDTLKNWLV